MGLQFRDEDGSTRTLTLEDMQSDLFKDSFSDLFKTLHGWRPRSAYMWEPSYMLRFFDDFEADMARKVEEERREDEDRLAYLCEKHNQSFGTLKEAQAFNEEAARQRYAREAEELRLAKLAKEKFNARYSPLPVIEDWMYGAVPRRICG